LYEKKCKKIFLCDKKRKKLEEAIRQVFSEHYKGKGDVIVVVTFDILLPLLFYNKTEKFFG